jgi:hypothetical protein
VLTRVVLDVKRGVFLLEALQRLLEVLQLVGAARRERNAHDWVWDSDGSHGEVHAAVGEGVTRGALDAKQGDDVTRRLFGGGVVFS